MKSKFNKFSIILSLILSLSLLFFLNISFNNYELKMQSLNNQEKLNLQCPINFNENNTELKLNINIPKNKKWIENLWSTYLDGSDRIRSKFKKNFNSEITIFDSKKNSCKLRSKIRISGDLKDHIKVINKNIVSSIDVTLKDGNIFNIIKFKLVLPETRTDANNAIVGTKILSAAGIISPQIKLVDVDFNGVKIQMLFEENPNKELIERNKFREGLIAETNEEVYWNEGIEVPMFMKPLNEKWSIANEINQLITLKQLSVFNYHMISSSKRYLELKDFNNETFLTANYFGFDTSDFNSDTRFNWAKYDLLMLSMNGWHGLRQHQRQFYFDNLSKTIYPIYKDGNLNFVNPDKTFNLSYDPYYLNSLTSQDKLYIDKTIEILKKIDLNNLSIDINYSGLEFTDDSLKIIIEGLINRLNYFKEINTINPHPVKLETAREYIKRYNWPINFENFELNEASNNLINCTNIIKNCDQIPLNQVNFSESFNQSNLSYRFFSQLNSYQNYIIENNKDKVQYKFGKVNLELPKSAKVLWDKSDNSLKIDLLNNTDRALIFNSDLNNISIEVSAINLSTADSQIRINEDSLTGCLTISNSLLSDISIKSRYLHCEDSLNIINSSGSVKDIEILGSYQDALDLDFSNLIINKVVIKDAGNDCLDFSSGNYNLLNSELTNCGDKAISVGEKANFKVNNTSIINAQNGIVVKDSSILDLTNLSLKTENIQDFQILSYRKKQEFGPPTIVISDKNFLKSFKTEIQRGTLFVFNR